MIGIYSISICNNILKHSWIPYVKKCHFDMLKTKTEKHQKVSINHFEHGAGALTSKKGMYLSLVKYLDNNKNELKKIIPETYILTENTSDKELEQFTYAFNQYPIICMKCNKKLESEDGNICKCEEPIKSKNIWIMKPPGANRGTVYNILLLLLLEYKII